MGSVTLSVYFLVLFVINPIQRHSYRMRAIKRLYFARSDEKNIFPTKSSSDKSNDRSDDLNAIKDLEDASLKNEISKHSTIRIHFSNWLSLFCGCSSDENLNILYEEGV